MLTPEERQGLERMSQEDLGKLLTLIRQAKAMLGMAGATPRSAVQAMAEAVPDKLCQEIVRDLRGGRAEPGFLPAQAARKPEEKRSGPVKALPLEPPSGVAHCDRIAEHFAALDKRDLEKRLRGGG